MYREISIVLVLVGERRSNPKHVGFVVELLVVLGYVHQMAGIRFHQLCIELRFVDQLLCQCMSIDLEQQLAILDQFVWFAHFRWLQYRLMFRIPIGMSLGLLERYF